MSKTFKAAPTPVKQPTDEQVLAFVHGGAAKGKAMLTERQTARLSLDIPASVHARFKAACARARLKMTDELLGFIERRTQELEANKC